MSGDEIFHDVSVNIGEPEIASIVAIGQLLVIETEQRQNGRVQIVNMNFALYRRRASGGLKCTPIFELCASSPGGIQEEAGFSPP